MAPLKFRAWHPDGKEMYVLPYQNYLGQSGIIDPYVGCEKAIWMQSTGLTDKTGREIYEGDVVVFESEKGMEAAVVLYDIPTASWLLAYVEGFTLAGHTYHNADPISRIGTDMLESIGNIYEHPHLLHP